MSVESDLAQAVVQRIVDEVSAEMGEPAPMRFLDLTPLPPLRRFRATTPAEAERRANDARQDAELLALLADIARKAKGAGA